MADLGDLPGLTRELFPAAARRARRPRVRCRNPRCRRWVYADRAIYGYGEDCAEELGLIPHRWKLTDHGQGQTLLDTLEVPVTAPRRFLLRHDAVTVAEGVLFSDGAVALYTLPTEGTGPSGNRHFDRYPVGTTVAGRLARSEIPRLLVPELGKDADLVIEWLDPPPAGGSWRPQTPTHRAELAEPDLTGQAPIDAEQYR